MYQVRRTDLTFARASIRRFAPVFALVLISIAAPHLLIAQVKTGASQMRSIVIKSSPKASVWIDGVLFGKTDDAGEFRINTVASGSHSIRLRADGFKETTRTLTALQKGEIRIALTETNDPAELAFQNAEKLSSSDREKAIEGYRAAIKLRSGYADAHIALARLLSENGDLEEAAKVIASVRKIRPALAEASAVEGRILKDGGEEVKAIAAFKRAITEGKGFQPEALTGLGLLYKERAEGFGGSGDFEQEKANYDEAIKYLKPALKQLSGAPDSVVIYQLLGLIYEREQRFDEAIAIYEEFLRLFPNSTEASAVRSFIEQIRKQLTDPD